MVAWSRSHSQSMGDKPGISSGIKCRMSSHLAVKSEQAKAHDKREYKRALEWADGKEVVKVRDYLGPVKAKYVPRGFGRKGQPFGLSPEKRALVTARNVQRTVFFDGLKS